MPTGKLLDRFGSGGHKPGSGSAAALLGLVSCKLIQTVVTLSNGRKEYQGVKEQLTLANQSVTDEIEPILYKALQEDSIQFDLVIQARLLRDAELDPAKKRVLSEASLAQLRKATDIPIIISENCLRLAERAITIFDLGFQSARGDSGVAISAALAASSGAISIIYLNLTRFRGGEWAIQKRKKADELFQQTQKLQLEMVSRLSSLQTEATSKEKSQQGDEFNG